MKRTPRAHTAGELQQATLFGDNAPTLPEGFLYHPDFLSPEEERELLAHIQSLAFGQVQMHGVVARRRTVQYGMDYAFETFRLSPGEPIPAWLLPLRDRVPELVPVAPGAIAEALITEYPEGATIGWHRDAPPFDIVIGISLLAECRMRFRPYVSPRATKPAEPEQRPRRRAKPLEQLLAPRSAYVIQGPARSRYQHSIPPTPSLRYSITFRTLR